MIPYYEKHCIELAIRRTHSKAIVKAKNALRKNYRDLMHIMLESYPGGSAFLQKMDRDIEDWVKESSQGKTTLAIMLPKENNDTIYIVQLWSIDSLKTGFGKKHHGKGIGFLIVFAFSQSKDIETNIAQFNKTFCEELQKAFKRKTPLRIAVVWDTIQIVNELKEKVHSTPTISAEIETVLDLLAHEEFRETIIRAKQAKDPTLENIVLSTGLSAVEVMPHLESALRHNILTRQFNVVCSSCQTPLARVHAKRAISQMSRDGVACPNCRTPINNDSYKECFVVVEKISKLLDGSKWMCMYVRRQIRKFYSGVTVLTEVVDGPNELDLIANIDGDLMLIELKDSRFAIGHAYSFVGKYSQYKPDIAIICSTEGIDEDVKEYLQKTGIDAHYIENLDTLDVQLSQIFSERNTNKLAALQSEVSWDYYFLQALMANFDTSLPMPEQPYSIRSSGARLRSLDRYWTSH